MSIETLLNGESKNVEYKLTPPSRSINYTKTAVAFANGQGGYIHTSTVFQEIWLLCFTLSSLTVTFFLS